MSRVIGHRSRARKILLGLFSFGCSRVTRARTGTNGSKRDLRRITQAMPARILPDSVHDSMTNPFAHDRAWWNHLDMHSLALILEDVDELGMFPITEKLIHQDVGQVLEVETPPSQLMKKSDTRGRTRCGSRSLYFGGKSQCQFVIIHVETTYSYTVFFKRRISLQFSSISDRPCHQKRLQSLAAQTNASKKRYCHVRWNKTQAQTHATHTHHIRRPQKVSGKWAINHHKAVNSYKWVVISN